MNSLAVVLIKSMQTFSAPILIETWHQVFDVFDNNLCRVIFKRFLKTYFAGHRGWLEKCGRPRPLGHDGGGCQADGDLAASVKGGVEVVSVVVDVLPHLEQLELNLVLDKESKMCVYQFILQVYVNKKPNNSPFNLF